MRILVTAGNTLVFIDRVRVLTNVFTGRTGAQIAVHAWERGHDVLFVTSHPEAADELMPEGSVAQERWKVRPYRTFEELESEMAASVRGEAVDAVVHCSAVSDYRAAGVYAPGPGTAFRAEIPGWEAEPGRSPTMLDRAAEKIKSDEPELWLRLVRTPKLIDRVRADWAFQGVLVKFKLETGVGDDELLSIAESSRRHSQADLMVANTLEGKAAWAYLGPWEGRYKWVTREELPARLLEAIEGKVKDRSRG